MEQVRGDKMAKGDSSKASFRDRWGSAGEPDAPEKLDRQTNLRSGCGTGLIGIGFAGGVLGLAATLDSALWLKVVLSLVAMLLLSSALAQLITIVSVGKLGNFMGLPGCLGLVIFTLGLELAWLGTQVGPSPTSRILYILGSVFIALGVLGTAIGARFMRQHADEKGVLSFYHPQRQLPDMPPLPLRWQLKGWLWSIVRSRMRGSCLVFPVIGAWLWAIWATFRGVSESYLAAAAIVGVLALLYLGVMAVAQIDRRKGYFLRGMNHFDESRWDSAIADLLQAMRPSLRDVWLYAPGMQERGWERICIALLELEEPSDAEEAVKYAFHQIGPVVGLYECLGISLNRQRRGAEAIEAWEIALEGARNDEERERIKKRIDKTRLLIGSTDQPS